MIILITQSQNFEGHPSIIAIEEQMKESNKTFTFQIINTDKVTLIIKNN